MDLELLDVNFFGLLSGHANPAFVAARAVGNQQLVAELYRMQLVASLRDASAGGQKKESGA
jgi:hypothetical protein